MDRDVAPEVRAEAKSEPDVLPPPAAEANQNVTLPEGLIPVLPLRDAVLFPGVVVPLTVGRERSLAAAQHAIRTKSQVAVLLQKLPEIDDPKTADMYQVGTVADVVRYVTGRDGGHHLICRGEARFRVVELVEGYPFMVARIERLAEPDSKGAELEARALQLKERALEALKLTPNAPAEFAAALEAITEPGRLADVLASFIDFKPEEKQQVLESLDLTARLDRVLWLLAYKLGVLRLSHDIGERTRETIEGRQREHILREQMRTIQKELGEDEGGNAEIAKLEEAIKTAKMPEAVETHAKRELARLKSMPEGSGETSMLRTYLEWLTELPWSVETAKAIDIAEARKVLNDDHFGLEKIKDRILEYLAVRKLNPAGRAPILCFVGPPGVGKTSLGKSIAKATGRAFARVSLGGVHDEAEIRGHRRTYIGALPGNIVQNIRRAGARDCVMMLDEIDKLGHGVHGDPSSAMLEVLDPAQNATFRDNYLAVDFDLSKVMFIATANVLDTIPGPLRDRMEVIQLAGYTTAEKLEIAKRYLVPRQIEDNGVKAEQFAIGDEALSTIIREYTREAGVRNLERAIGSVVRHYAVRIAEGASERFAIGADAVHDILGSARFEPEQASRISVPGVATGLAWTPVGGDILYIEATKSPGAGKLILTGQLGEVMKESAQTALSLLKSKYRALGLRAEQFEKQDIHVHVPAGAVPKDGPSAGVAMYMALASLFTERTVRPEVAMTGEVSLRGLVLPVGGIKEKVLAAMLAGIKTVVLPSRNKKDWDDIPEEARKGLTFVWAETVDQALEAALAPAPANSAAA